MTDSLTSSVRAVYDAFNRIGLYNEPSFKTDRKALAAALRAAANDWRVDTEFIGGVEYIRTSTLDAIATELESVE
jgi:hypothetical protein